MTSQVRIQPCSEERCDARVFINRGNGDVADEPCDFLSGASIHEDDHEFVPHTHVPECDARWWREVMGCDAKVLDNGLIRCARIFASSDVDWDHCDERHPDGIVTLAPVLSGTAWEAVPVMLAEIERREWWALIEAERMDNAIVRLLDNNAGEYDDPLVGSIIYQQPLPRALALALWNAVTNG